MSGLLRQIEQKAARDGASIPFNYIMDNLPGAVAGAAYSGAKKTIPDTVENTKQRLNYVNKEYVDPLGQRLKDMLPAGVSVGANPSFIDPTVTPRLDLSAISPYVQGSAGATLGPQGLLGYNIDAQVPMGAGFTGVGNYGPQGGNVGVNYAQGGWSAGVNAPVAEHTSGVSDMLRRITASFRYTGKF